MKLSSGIVRFTSKLKHVLAVVGLAAAILLQLPAQAQTTSEGFLANYILPSLQQTVAAGGDYSSFAEFNTAWQSHLANWNLAANYPDAAQFASFVNANLSEINALLATFGAQIGSVTAATVADGFAQMQAGQSIEGLATALGIDIDDLESLVMGMESSSAEGVASPVAPNVLGMQQTFVSSVFQMATPAGRGQQDARGMAFAGGFAAGGDAFYDQTKFEGGTDIDTFGGFLSGTWTSEDSRLRVKATLPIYQTSADDFDLTTFGVDLNVRYSVIATEKDTVGVGLHGGMLGFSGDDIGDDYYAVVGPLLSYTRKLNDTFSLSVGTVADYVGPDQSEDTWIWAAGTQLGVRIGEKIALNPFYIYFRNMDAPDRVDEDWHDVGLQMAVDLAETWTLGVGVKTSIDYDGVDSSWQIFLGTNWKF